MFPTLSVAVAVKVCGPSASALLVWDVAVVQAAAGAPSSAQTTVEPASEAVNWKVGLEVFRTLPAGLDRDTVGPTVSTVHVAVAAALELRAASSAWAASVCVPWPRPVRFAGLVQAAGTAPSRAHWNVAPASVSEKLITALVLATTPLVLAAPMVGAGGATESWT
jgi:hypothetical protein